MCVRMYIQIVWHVCIFHEPWTLPFLIRCEYVSTDMILIFLIPRMEIVIS